MLAFVNHNDHDPVIISQHAGNNQLPAAVAKDLALAKLPLPQPYWPQIRSAFQNITSTSPQTLDPFLNCLANYCQDGKLEAAETLLTKEHTEKDILDD